MEENRPKKIRNKKKTKIISFDDEIVTKDNAVIFLKNEKHKQQNKNEESVENTSNFLCSTDGKKQKNKGKSSSENLNGKRKVKSELNNCEDNHIDNSNQNDSTEKLKTNKNKYKKTGISETTKNTEGVMGETEETDIANTESVKPPKKESKRAQKRKKFEEQVAAKKLKSESGFQEKALNYLSKWKHCRSDWKFEKLRQVWLQQNLFDLIKVPEEFWEAAVEYFSGSKGQSRQQLLDEAVKIVEQEEQSEISVEEDKLKRAMDIVQHLQ